MCSFIKEFLTKPTSTGAITSSSFELADLITDAAEVEKYNNIVEVGSGTGVFTEMICDKKLANSKFFVLELNQSFAQATKKRCPEINVFNDSALNINVYLDDLGYEGCDCLISSLPWASFNNETQDDILNSIYSALLPGGRFVTFVYVHSKVLPSGKRFKNKLKEMFGQVKQTKTVWKNVPPAFVYLVTK